jgi:type I restriction enzyme M protein
LPNPKNDYNLNLPRYIDSSEPEDLQDIDGHLRGGIPERDIDALGDYWKIMPGLRVALLEKFNHPDYCHLRLSIADVKPAIFGHAEFAAFHESATRLFAKWKQASTPRLKGFANDGHPKPLIETISENLLATFKAAPLLDAYDVYQHLMDYWGRNHAGRLLSHRRCRVEGGCAAPRDSSGQKQGRQTCLARAP